MVSAVRQQITRAVDIVGAAAPYILGAILIAAATAKIWSLDQFSWFVTTVNVFPPSWRDWLPFVIPLVEILVGGMLLTRVAPTAGLVCCVALLVTYTGFLLLLVLNPAAPSCNCFGVIRLARHAMTENRISLVRNIWLLLLAAVGLQTHFRRSQTTGTKPGT